LGSEHLHFAYKLGEPLEVKFVKIILPTKEILDLVSGCDCSFYSCHCKDAIFEGAKYIVNNWGKNIVDNNLRFL
jgi:hypothetical protein